MKTNSQGGFTLIELLFVVATLGVLCAIGFNYYRSYMDNARFTQAELALKDARLALEAGFEYSSSQPLVFGVTGSAGEPLAPPLDAAMPGMNMTPGVKLQVSIFNCGDPDHTQMQFVTSYACEAKLYTWWARLCNGAEIRMPKLVMGAAC